MPFGYLEVNHAVPWGYGHYTGAKIRVNRVVFNDRAGDWAVNPLCLKRVTMLILGVTLVLGMHHYVLIGELCFWPCGCYFERPKLKRIKAGRLLFVHHLIIRYVGFEVRIPVYDTVTSVNKAVTVHLSKYLANTTCQGWIERVA